ncbi:MAG: OmpA family protein, partial [Flavobacteriales bacterium]|nr:OmpA family protein [Flavobacteriales bacterium]
YVEDTSILDISITGQYLSGNEAKPKGVRIVLQDSEGEEVAEVYTKEDGMFKFESVSPDDAYTITAENVRADDVILVLDGTGRILQTIVPDPDGGFVYVRLAPEVKSVTLTNERKEKVKVETGTEIDLPDVYFELNKSTLTERGMVSLQKLLVLMENNPKIRVELAGHTDSRGNADYNLKLSRERMASVVAYLTGRGIEPHRISGKGYGESQLRNHCRDGTDCSEEEHAVNRRTEFKIYEIND